MKKWISLMTAILLIVVFVFSGCGTAEETERTPGESESGEQLQNEPMNDQEAEIPDGAEPNAQDDNKSENEAQQTVILTEYSFDAYDPEGFVIPVLRVETVDPDAGNGYRMIWDLENGTLTGEELLFTGASFEKIYETVWTGGNLLAGSDRKLECQPGVAYAPTGNIMFSNFGQCYYDYQNGIVFRLAHNGVEQFIAPQIPEGVCEEKFESSPAYVYVDEDGRMFTVYQRYITGVKDNAYYVDMKLVYGWASASGEPEGDWSCVQIPMETAKRIDYTENTLVYLDGKLYMGTIDDVLVLDTASGTISFLGLWEKMGVLYADKTLTAEGVPFSGKHKILGSYGDIILVRSTVIGEAAAVYCYTVAIRGDEVVGAIESVVGQAVYTVYNSMMIPGSTFETAAILKFPKDK